MPFLVIDDRFPSPVYVFLDAHPQTEDEFPGLPVREVQLEALPPGGGWGSSGPAVGQNPWQADSFRVFGSERAVTGLGFTLIEPRYVGTSWGGYVRSFRPEGGSKSGGSPKPGPGRRKAAAAAGGRAAVVVGPVVAAG